MKSYLVTCTYSGGTKQGYMHGEDYEEGTAESQGRKSGTWHA